jgi:hypothetical protein
MRGSLCSCLGKGNECVKFYGVFSILDDGIWSLDKTWLGKGCGYVVLIWC